MSVPAPRMDLVEEPLFELQAQQLAADPQMRPHLARVAHRRAGAYCGSHHNLPTSTCPTGGRGPRHAAAIPREPSQLQPRYQRAPTRDRRLERQRFPAARYKGSKPPEVAQLFEELSGGNGSVSASRRRRSYAVIDRCLAAKVLVWVGSFMTWQVIREAMSRDP